LAALALMACAPPPAAPLAAPASSERHEPAAVEPAPLSEEVEPEPPKLRTGRIKPIEHAETLVLKVRRHALDGDQELLELVLPDFASETPGDIFWRGTEARLSGGSAPFQLVSSGKNAEMLLWLRRPKAEAGSELAGDAYTPAGGARPGHHFRFRAPAAVGGVSPGLASEWASLLAGYFASEPSAFGSSAAASLVARYQLAAQPGSPWSARGSSSSAGTELSRLMDTFTGRSAVQEALARNHALFLAASKQPRNIPIAQLKPPRLARHPWAELSKRLPGKQPIEVLANAVPADFYFVRAKSFGAFTDILDFVQGFGAPAANLLDGAASARGSLPRYLAELGMETSDLSRVLGPEVVEDFAVVGSDPYVHEGSDVTLIFRLKSPLLFRAALLKALASHGAAHGGTQPSSFSHEGVTVEVARSTDGRVRQHHAVVGELELVSNSPAAIKRVISAIKAKLPRLADEPDFRYMLARDPDVPAGLLAFIGDRWVENVVGPAQKIAEARRQLALAELTAAPFSALLYGWLNGRSPLDKAELLRSGLLLPAALQHPDGARIDWAPGSAPRSTWGTPAALEPLIDLPPVVKASAAERDGYAEFARAYELRWSQYIDPIALRVSTSETAEGKSLHAEMRVLPLVPADSALRFDWGGDGHVAPPELASGARLAIGIGPHSHLREELAQDLTLLASGGPNIQLDWLGDYALVGSADRAELLLAAQMTRETRDFPIERPASAEELGRDDAARDSDIEALVGLPVYAVIGLHSRVAAAVALTGLRRLAETTVPGSFEWAPFASHRGVEVVRIAVKERGSQLALYYAMTADALIVSLNRSVMRSLIEQALDGALPKPGVPLAALAREGQAVFELAPLKNGSIRTLLGWAMAASALAGAPEAEVAAEAVLRGVPESAHDPERSAELSLTYLGVAPLTPEGRRYWLAPDGIADPRRGTAHAPEWPALPVAESPADVVLTALARLRCDLSFDDEPQISSTAPRLRSLRARLDLRLR